MLPKKYFVLIATAFFILHFILQGATLMAGFSITSQEFNNADKPESERSEAHLTYTQAMLPFHILSFPVYTLLVYTPLANTNFPPENTEAYLLAFNSLLWSIAFYFLVLYIAKRKQNKQGRKKPK